MTEPFYRNRWVDIWQGDCRDVMRQLPEQSVHSVLTSPPYWGLRTYGDETAAAVWGGDPEHAHVWGAMERGKRKDIKPADETRAGRLGVNRQQTVGVAAGGRYCACGAWRGALGLEPTPDQFVANMREVAREVWRVLRDDGTLWLNLGDSYVTGRGVPGLKPKDLAMIPSRVAMALQEPQYTGRIRDERDRIWLAAMLDAEGCLFIHKRKKGQHNGQGYYRTHDSYGPGVEIANTSLAVVERIMALVRKGSISSQSPEQNGRRKQTIYRWNLRTTESRDFVREIYPHLVAKQQQARILIGCPSSGERAEAAHAALMALHRTGVSDVDFPAPGSMFEPGWYLRTDVVWSKGNPMPENTDDRPVRAHEFIFLLAKQERYYYDGWAVREKGTGREGEGDRGLRDVWWVPTRPYPGAHFAVFPPDLIRPAIRAGTPEKVCPECGAPWRRRSEKEHVGPVWNSQGPKTMSNLEPSLAEGRAKWPTRYRVEERTTGWEPTCGHDTAGEPVPGVVLDPFGGSGTVGLVAQQEGRRAVLIDLTAEYLHQQLERTVAEWGVGGKRQVDDGTAEHPEDSLWAK